MMIIIIIINNNCSNHKHMWVTEREREGRESGGERERGETIMWIGTW